MSALPDPVLLITVALGLAVVFALNEARAWAWRRHKRRAGDRPVPGADQAIALTEPPAPGEGTPAKATEPPPVAIPGAGPDEPHGGLVKSIYVYSDGRTEITDHRKHTTETIEGDCAQCSGGTCTWCSYYPVYDMARNRWIRRYQRCPAHQDKERQS